jgi:lipopolysaccharide export system permease protein
MGLIERYIFRRLLGSFAMALGGLAGVVWVTQALRSMNLVTARGQTLLVFFEIMLLALPLLVVVVAPFALLIGGVFTLNSFNADSELVIVSAAGGSRVKVARPVMVASLLVSLAMLAFTVEVAPMAQHWLRVELTKINVDLIANIMRPGRFVEVEKGLTFHIRNRAGDGTLVGLMINDRRDKDLTFTYIADHAVVVEAPGKTLLVMRDGVVQRVTNKDGALSIIDFEAYAFDLSQLSAQNVAPTFRPNERMTSELLAADTTTEDGRKNASKFRGEIVDRFSQPLLPLAFGAILLIMLGDARTTRQGRGLAVTGTFAAALGLRAAHFAATSAAVGSAAAMPFAFVLLLGITIGGLVIVLGDFEVSLPEPVTRLFDWLSDVAAAIARRFSPGPRGEGGAA